MGGASERGTVYRCKGVQGSGTLWLGLGVAAGIGGAVMVAAHQHAALTDTGIALFALAVILLVGGAGILRSSIEVTASSVVSRWLFSTTRYPLTSLQDATLALPKSVEGRWQGDYVSPRANADSELASGLFTLGKWALVPASAADQVLHLIPKVGGAIPLRAIAARTAGHPGDAGTALEAVKRALKVQPASVGYTLPAPPERAAAPAPSSDFVDWGFDGQTNPPARG